MMRKIFLLTVVLALVVLTSCTVLDDFDFIDDGMDDMDTPAEEGGLRLTLAVEAASAVIVEQTADVVRARAEALSPDAQVLISGSLLTVDLPDVSDRDLATQTLTRPGVLLFLDMLDPPEAGTVIDPSAYAAALTGEAIAEAEALPPDTERGWLDWSVSVIWTPEGRAAFAEYTATHVGQYLAVVLDGEVIMAPRIMEAIDSESALISGDFTEAEVRALVIQLQSGVLPVPVSVTAVEALEP